MSSRAGGAAPPCQRRLTGADSPLAPRLSQPELEQQTHGLRNPRIAGDPATEGTRIDPQPLSGLHLVQGQLAQDAAELLRQHGHSGGHNVPAAIQQGKLSQVAAPPALSPGANCPTFSARWPVVRWRPLGNRCARRSSCSRSSTTSCASWAPARCRGTTRFVRLQQRGAECGSLWPLSVRAPTRFALGLGSPASHAHVPRSVRSCSRLPPWSRAQCSPCCGRCGGRCGWSSGWLTPCGRSGRESPSDSKRTPGLGRSTGAWFPHAAGAVS